TETRSACFLRNGRQISAWGFDMVSDLTLPGSSWVRDGDSLAVHFWSYLCAIVLS
ncbi:hypothetical protein ACJX0J_028707, partial [Zea mays]